MLKEFTEAVLKVRRCDLATGIATWNSGPGSGPTFLSSSPKARQHKVPPQPRNSQAPRAYTESSRQRYQLWHVWRKDTGLGLQREPNFTLTSQCPGTEPRRKPPALWKQYWCRQTGRHRTGEQRDEIHASGASLHNCVKTRTKERRG